MRRGFLFVALAAAFVSAAAPASAQQTEPAPRVDATAVLVANAATGEVIFARNADARAAIASITKLMTALVVLEHAHPEDVVTVRRLASTVGESTVHLRPGERISVRDLLAAALIQSANDAAFALAAHVGDGDVRRFVRLMNAEARELGLEDTHFVRPDGLDVPGHYSSAEDVLALARAAMRRPLVRRLVRMESGRIAGGRTLFAWNDLLGEFPGLRGVKTGHTAAAGWCQVAFARRDGVGVYAVVLGSPSRGERNRDLAAILEWGFAQYVRLKVVVPERTYATAEVPFSDERLALLAAGPAAAVVHVGRPLVEEIVVPATVELPVRRGKRLGEIRVLEGDRVVARRPLVAAETVGDAGLEERAGWYADRAFSEAGEMLSGVFGGVL
ncbi:MAG TPA: D-alanyl-D-alanine carboxypeptidase family protein [Gaiellaceae bacterium]|nr:D-alanyl-D-alanine carboxypeptidase family protein [Gaiellaceae bacterium]